jgi:profilin
MEVIVAAFANADAIYAEGFKVDGEKYTAIRVDDTALLGKRVRFVPKRLFQTSESSNIAMQGKEGFVATMTTQALILAHHPDTVATQTAAGTVQALGDYLRSLGY